MSWHYLQGQEVASWGESSLDGAPSALLRLIPTAATSSLHVSERDTSSPSQSGTTYEPSTAPPGGGQLTLFPVASPARTSARQVPAKDLPGTVQAFSLKCSESLKRCGLGLYSRRTRRICVPVDLAPSSKDLPGWGMTAGGGCWELGTLVRHISETGCGLWPGRLVPTLRANKWGVEDSHGDVSAWESLLLTATARLYGTNRGGAAGRVGPERPSLEKLVGGINLPLREWIMGWPIGWTALEPLGTDRFQRWLRSHGGC